MYISSSYSDALPTILSCNLRFYDEWFCVYSDGES